MPERIFLTYTNATAIPYQGSTLGHHTVLNYIDSNGFHHTLQGMPGNKYEHNAGKLWAFVKDQIRSNVLNLSGPPFGRLQSNEREGVASDTPYTLFAEGDDLSSNWKRMKEFGDELN